jgi:glycosyltransferase involved in cell wall biosynthesis
MTEAQPLLTIAIATLDRPQLLAQVLDSCAAQRVEDSLVEILVVLDGASEGSRVAFDQFEFHLRQLGRHLTARLIEPWSQPHGLAATRNVCADEAAGRWIRFQDDDDVLDPYASAAMLAGHSQYGKHTALLGYTGVAPHIFELPLMHYLDRGGGELFSYQAAEENRQLGFQWFWGGRTSVETELVQKLRFDESLLFGAEDIEFAFRASTERNLRVLYSKSVRSYMVRALNLDGFVGRNYQQGKSARYVARKHPGTMLERWAFDSHLYCQWDGDAGAVLSQAAKRCRRLELTLDFFQQGVGPVEAVRQVLNSAYRETFGLARAMGFLGHDLPPL